MTRSFIAWMLLATATPAAAQTTSVRTDLGRLAGDAWSVWTAPARLDHRTIAPVAAAVGVFAAATLVDSTVAAWMATHQNTALLRGLSPIRSKGLFPLYDLPSEPWIDVASILAFTTGKLTHNVALAN